MGTTEIIFIFVVYLLFFGSKGIPSLAQNMGKAIRTFKDASQDIQREIMSSANDIKNEASKSVQDQRARFDKPDLTERPLPPLPKTAQEGPQPIDQPQPPPPSSPNPDA